MQLFLNLFIFTDAIHVSGGYSAHHQEHIAVHTASGIVNNTAASCCRGGDGTDVPFAPDDGRSSLLKPVQRM